MAILPDGQGKASWLHLPVLCRGTIWSEAAPGAVSSSRSVNSTIAKTGQPQRPFPTASLETIASLTSTLLSISRGLLLPGLLSSL